jgi:hypothetical protein
MFAVTALSVMSNNINFSARAVDIEADSVNVPDVSTLGSCRQNMLNTDSAVITDANCSAIFSKNRTLTANYQNLPVNLASGKVIAVLVDEYVAPGTAYMSKFLDQNGSVTFENIDVAVKLPQIHLYKQNPGDPDYLLRKENFIAKNMFPMSYVKNLTNNGGLTGQNLLTTYNGDTQSMDGALAPAGKPVIYKTTVPHLYSISLPIGYLANLNPNWGGLTPGQIFGVLIAEDEKGNAQKVSSVVSSNYYTNEFCRFDFIVPDGLNNFQFHLYKDILLKENFLCKYRVTVSNQEGSQYQLES